MSRVFRPCSDCELNRNASRRSQVANEKPSYRGCSMATEAAQWEVKCHGDCSPLESNSTMGSRCCGPLFGQPDLYEWAGLWGQGPGPHSQVLHAELRRNVATEGTCQGREGPGRCHPTSRDLVGKGRHRRRPLSRH